MPAETTLIIKTKNLNPQELAKFSADIQKCNKNFIDTNKSAVQFESTSKKLSGALTGVGGIVATLGVAKLSGDIIKASTTMDSLNRMLVNAEGNQEKANKRFAEFRKLAKEPVLDPFNLSKFYVQLKSVNVESELSTRFMKSLANSMAGIGAGNEEFQRAMTQFVQMAGQGKLIGQDLRVITESFPQMRKFLREAFEGVSDPEQLAKAGHTAIEVFTKLNDVMEKQPKFAGGAQAAQDNFRQSMQLFEGELGKGFLPTFGKLLDYLTKLMDGFNDLPNGVKTAIGTGTGLALGGTGLLGLAGTVSFLVNQIKILTGVGGISAVANASAGVASTVASNIGVGAGSMAGWVRNPKIAEGMADAWVREGAYAASKEGQFLAGSAALQIATATIAVASLVWSGKEIYEALTRDFTPQEKEENKNAPTKFFQGGLKQLQELQMGKGNFPDMPIKELGDIDINPMSPDMILKYMGLPENARELSLRELKAKYGYAYPIYDKEFGPPEPKKPASTGAGFEPLLEEFKQKFDEITSKDFGASEADIAESAWALQPKSAFLMAP